MKRLILTWKLWDKKTILAQLIRPLTLREAWKLSGAMLRLNRYYYSPRN